MWLLTPKKSCYNINQKCYMIWEQHNVKCWKRIIKSIVEVFIFYFFIWQEEYLCFIFISSCFPFHILFIFLVDSTVDKFINNIIFRAISVLRNLTSFSSVVIVLLLKSVWCTSSQSRFFISFYLYFIIVQSVLFHFA